MKFEKKEVQGQKSKHETQKLDWVLSEQVQDSNELGKKNKGCGIASSLDNSEIKKKGKQGINPKNLKKLLKEKEEGLKQKHDQLLRAQAEFENFKKRMVRERADLLKFGNESLMKELLPVIDDLERSLKHMRGASQTDTIVDSIKMIRKELLKKLEKFGLKQITAQGEMFDPFKHEAVAQVETPEYSENTIVKELQKGYFLHDRLLRPAIVKVAKSPTTS